MWFECGFARAPKNILTREDHECTVHVRILITVRITNVQYSTVHVRILITVRIYMHNA
jgi:hypothetical protein